MFGSLYVRLLATFVVVLAVGIAVAALVAERTATHEFSAYVSANDAAYLKDLASQLGARYSQTGSWQGIQSFFDTLPQTTGRVSLRDASGTVVATTARGPGAGPGSARGGGNGPSGASTKSASVIANGNEVGTLVAVGPATSQASSDAFVSRMREALIAGGIVSLALALSLAAVLVASITRPLRKVAAAAHNLAAGRLSQRVDTRGPRETAEVARAFNAMAEGLESGQRQRRQLLADIVHELRTPLAVIQGTSQGFVDGVIPADEEHAGVIRDEAALMSRIVTDLRDLSLAEAGELRLDLAPTDLGEVARIAVAAFQERASSLGILFSLSVGEEAATATVDRDRSLQVLRNLIDNALQHTPEGGSISVNVCKPDDTSVAIEVRDTGEGIAPEHLPHIFDRFYRIDPSRQRKSGTGLGLAIVKLLTEAQGGSVSVESKVGEGSTFRLRFPTSTGGIVGPG